MPASKRGRAKRITDTARLDWLSETKAEAEYVTAKVGPGWVRDAGWRVFVGARVRGTGDTLRKAIDNAMKGQTYDN